MAKKNQIRWSRVSILSFLFVLQVVAFQNCSRGFGVANSELTNNTESGSPEPSSPSDNPGPGGSDGPPAYSLKPGEYKQIMKNTFAYGVWGISAAGRDVYVGTTPGLYISHDGGLHFEGPTIEKPRGIGRSLISGLKVYVPTMAGLYFSKDNGLNFSLVENVPAPNVQVQSIFKEGKNLYVSRVDGLLISNDEGVTFTKVLDKSNVIGTYAYGSIVCVGTMEGVMCSQDGGKTFSTALISGNVQQITGKDSKIYVITDGGSYKANADTLDFKPMILAEGSGVPVKIVFSAGSMYVLTSTNLQSSTDGGESFVDLNAPISQVSAAIDFSIVGKNIFVSTLYGLFVGGL